MRAGGLGHMREGCIMHRGTVEGVVFHLKGHAMNDGVRAEGERERGGRCGVKTE